ncbi:serine protease [Deinococcus lacus]|uniref:Serine protease n=1 Tax=Deinococcus lacus TaxID=392561 RepID=A0ABW1Y9X8_9DEIO
MRKLIASALLGFGLLTACGNSVPVATAPAPEAAAPTTLGEQVIYGDATTIAKRPYQVALLYDGTQFCGGTLISKDWVLTAAHCLDGVSASRLKVRAGSASPYSGGQLLNVSRYVIHSNYRSVEFGYDVAVLKLSSSVTTSSAQPALIPTSSADNVATAVGRYLTISGWGRTDPYSNTASSTLREASLPVLSYDDCDNQLAPLLGDLYLAQGTVCGGVNRYSQSGCQGDSGGPFAGQGDNGKYYVFGIVSWGNVPKCNAGPTAFTRVATYNAWITQQTGISASN